MLYTYTNVQGFSGAPGCPSHGHTKTADKSNRQFAISCPTCEAFLANNTAWKTNPSDVPMTQNERIEAERLEREAKANQVLVANGIARAVAEQLNVTDSVTVKPRRTRTKAKVK